MMAVVVGVTGATLYITTQRIQEAYEKLSEQRFDAQVQLINLVQQSRLEGIQSRCRDFAGLVRLRAAMRALNGAIERGDDEFYESLTGKVYQTAEDELAQILNTAFADRPVHAALFFRFLDGRGEVMTPPPGTGAGLAQPEMKRKLAAELKGISQTLDSADTQQVGYLAPEVTSGKRRLTEVVVTKIEDDPDPVFLGALVIGFSLPEEEFNQAGQAGQRLARLVSGILISPQFYPFEQGEVLSPELQAHLQLRISNEPKRGDFIFRDGDGRRRVFYERLDLSRSFPPAYQVSSYSMEEADAAERALRGRVIALGALALLGALVMSLLLSHGLAVPIQNLSAGTEEVRKGNFSVRVPVRTQDEIGKLAASFNEMTEGLAQKERYRSVLNMVADKDVAEELMRGEVALGGEARDVSILFCDVRGFTALTQNMDPAEVIEFLNEHMTALTAVVYDQHGVVDKFVGDALMAIFGAPKSYGMDAENAARCGLQMIEARRRLNESSRFQIEIGVGIATGRVVAGCMGSADRLNYTVLGQRVNLASRLCGQAGRMEVVIDEGTRRQLGSAAVLDAMPEARLKGFTEPVQSYKLIALSPANSSG